MLFNFCHVVTFHTFSIPPSQLGVQRVLGWLLLPGFQSLDSRVLSTLAVLWLDYVMNRNFLLFFRATFLKIWDNFLKQFFSRTNSSTFPRWQTNRNWKFFYFCVAINTHSRAHTAGSLVKNKRLGVGAPRVMIMVHDICARWLAGEGKNVLERRVELSSALLFWIRGGKHNWLGWPWIYRPLPGWPVIKWLFIAIQAALVFVIAVESK